MKGASLVGSEALADLKQVWKAGSQQPLHAYFRRRMKVTCAGADGIDMDFGGWGGNDLRGFHFQVILLHKESSDSLDHSGAQP